MDLSNPKGKLKNKSRGFRVEKLRRKFDAGMEALQMKNFICDLK